MDFNEREKAPIARLKKAEKRGDLTRRNPAQTERDAFETLYRDKSVGCADIKKAPSPGAYRVVHVFGAYLVRDSEEDGNDHSDDHWYKKPVGIIVLSVTAGLLLLLIKFLLGV